MKKFFTFAAFLSAVLTFSQVVSGNIGIGTTNPTAKLDVIGKIKITDGTQGDGKQLISDANGLASWEPAPGTITINGAANETGAVIFIDPANTTQRIVDSPITLNKGTYTLYYYVQFDYYTPGNPPIARNVDVTNSETFKATFPQYIYFDFVVSSGAARFPSYPWDPSLGTYGPDVIPVINYFQVVSKVSQLVIVEQDNTVIRPRYYGIKSYGRVSGTAQIIAVKM